MTLKKIPYYLVIGLLAIGASLIIGLLSFGGMFALWPILPLAFAAFGLSVAYEGEIYLQNIGGALDKLFKPNYLKRQLGNDYLRTHFPDTDDIHCPQFFKDYKRQLKLYHQFEHKRLDAESRARKKHIEKTLRDMEKWFAMQLFSEIPRPTYVDMARQCIPKNAVLHSLKTLPVLGKFDPTYIGSYIYIESTRALYSVGQSNVIKEVATYKERIRAENYEAHLQSWLCGCDLRVMQTLPETKGTYANTYIFIEQTNTLVYCNADGDFDPITIHADHIDAFKENLDTLMKGSAFKRLTRTQIDALTQSPTEPNARMALMLDDNARLRLLHAQRRTIFQFAQVGSVVAGLFMGLGTTYLLVEAFTVIPFLAAIPALFWPALILPMAVVAASAYGLLTYNAITDMIANDTLRAWYKKLRDDLSQGLSVRNVLLTITALALFALTIALTICTAGTWWTIAKHAQPLFTWMRKMPGFIMQVLNPLILGLFSAWFNLENTAETLSMINDATQPKSLCDLLLLSTTPSKDTLEALPFSSDAAYIRVLSVDSDALFYVNKITQECTQLPLTSEVLNQFDTENEAMYEAIYVTKKAQLLSFEQFNRIKSTTGHNPRSYFFEKIVYTIQASFTRLHAKENAWQIANPFRLLLKLTITPLRILFFMGHLISIGVTSDRLPGVPEIVSALLGIISEGFEDAHYFFDADHAQHGHDTQSLLNERLSAEHGHNHDQDIPTRILKIIFYPLYCLAALWDSVASQSNTVASGRPVLDFNRALEKQQGLEPESSITVTDTMPSPSLDWQKQHVHYLLERRREKLAGVSVGFEDAESKRGALKTLQDRVLVLNFNKPQALEKTLASDKENPTYKKHRLTPTFFAHDETATASFMSHLHQRTKSPTSIVDDLLEDNNSKLHFNCNC